MFKNEEEVNRAGEDLMTVLENMMMPTKSVFIGKNSFPARWLDYHELAIKAKFPNAKWCYFGLTDFRISESSSDGIIGEISRSKYFKTREKADEWAFIHGGTVYAITIEDAAQSINLSNGNLALEL